MIQAGINKIAVKLNKFYKDELGSEEFKVQIMVSEDDDIMKGKYIRTEAEIFGLPLAVVEEEHPIHDDTYLNFDEFFENLKKSTHVYFDYKALNEDEFIESSSGDKIYFVDIINVFCSTSGNGETAEIYPNTNITLCKPFYGFGYKDIVMPDGTKIHGRESSLGIVYDTNPSPHERIGVVAYAESGSDLSQGDIVMREPKTNYEYEVAGQLLYVVPTDLILGAFTGTDFENHTMDDVRDEYEYDIDATESFDELWGDQIEADKDSFRDGSKYFTS